ncbi:MAG: c-type cytochrome [Gammaproteobacteria bacterium]|nr:c-type cytochrome [Gammaproteobacteria bacterium]MBT8151479.1 c-type cytochrome [Gammaproteobacteria bacterium]NNM10769.1 c-type cytochrome [Pseudomonadales bacterium]
MRIISLALLYLLVVTLTACNTTRQSAVGFSLPQGVVKQGEFVYTTMRCNSCHSLPAIEQLPDKGGQNISVALGGNGKRLKTDGELVSAIINPSHRITQSYLPQHTDAEGKSTMRKYNEVMTVSQLIDLVSFLQSQYEIPHDERILH